MTPSQGLHAASSASAPEEEMKVRPGLYTKDALAWALHRNGRSEEAKSVIADATKYGTPDARVLYHAGAIRIATGDDKEGRALVERALALNPAFDAKAAPEARALVRAGVTK